MTPERLKTLIAASDRSALCAAIAPLDETQRHALSSAAVAIYQQTDSGWGPGGIENKSRAPGDVVVDADFLQTLAAADYVDWRVPRLAAGLAVLAVCDRDVLEKPLQLSSWLMSDLRDMPQRVLEVLDARRPKWLAGWVAKQVRVEFPMVTWFVERGLIRSGALPDNNSDDYIRRMAEDFSALQADAVEVVTDNLPVVYRSRRELLLADPQLLRHDVWRLFEVENNAFVNSGGWDEALIGLSESGHLDRQRLLRASARAMGLPFRQRVASGYAKFHEALVPTVDERDALVDEYLALLGCDEPLCVGAALDALEALAKEKRLSADRFLAAAPAVFQIAKKLQPAKAIKLIKLLLKQNPICGSAVTEAISPGAGHAAPDIQAQVIELLETLSDQITAAARQELTRWVDAVAAALKPRLEALSRDQGVQGVPATAEPTGSRMALSELDQLRARAREIPELIRSLAGVDATLQAIDQQADPPACRLDPRRIPHRNPQERVEPLGSLEELIDTVARVIERIDDVIDLERILDGISRFYALRPDDFDKRVGALRKRVDKLSELHSWTIVDIAADVGLAQVIRAWLGMPEVRREWGEWYDMRGWFLRHRTRELLWRMHSKEATVPLLALPTHRGGWLDPIALVNRINEFYERPMELIDNCDLAQAILRLTPDGRNDALQALGEPSHYNGGLTLRFALGDDVECSNHGGLGADELRIAAVRTRSACEDVASWKAPCPVGIVALDAQGRLSVSGPVTQDPALPSDTLLYVFSDRNGAAPRIAQDGKRQWVTDWETLAWPMDPRPGCLMGRLQHLLDHGMSWGEEASRLAVQATSDESSEVRGLVTDALVDALGQLRVDPALLGTQLARNVEYLKLNRTSGVLSQVARISPLHHWSVFRMLDQFVANLTSTPQDLHAVLTALLECATMVGQSPGEGSCQVLSQMGGSSKTTKLSKQLLSLVKDSRKMAEVRVQACAACLDRAENWQALLFNS